MTRALLVVALCAGTARATTPPPDLDTSIGGQGIKGALAAVDVDGDGAIDLIDETELGIGVVATMSANVTAEVAE